MNSPGPDDGGLERRGSPPTDLADIFRPDLCGKTGWRADELGEIFAHQMAAPLGSDVAKLLPRVRASAEAVAGAARPPIVSFRDLLCHSDPPVGLLELGWDFAQALLRRGEGGSSGGGWGLPREVVSALSWSTAAAAMARHGRCIGGLDETSLRRGLTWVAGQDWIDPTVRSLSEEGLSRSGSGGSSAVGADRSSRTSDAALTLCSAAPDPLADVPRIDGYQITARLGEGGMGTVWRAVQCSTRREVALKLLSGPALRSDRSRRRFEREIELAARLRHPNIARVYDSGNTGGERAVPLYYAMELVEGGRHFDRYTAEERLQSRQVLALMREVCLAVQHAHLAGVIHRDLKPSNILVDRDGQPRVLDFGLARAVAEAEDGPDWHVDGAPSLTQEGQWAGTPAFMSPEQSAGRSDRIDTRADIYGLGATLYLLLTGTHPHDMSGSRYEVIRRVVEGDVRPPRQVRPEIDPELEALLLKALAREPEARYASAGEMAAEIDRYLRGDPLTARRQTALYVGGKWLAKHRSGVVLAASVALLVLGMGGASCHRVAQQRDVADHNWRLAQLGQTSAEREADAAKLAGRRAELSLAAARLAQGDLLAQAGRWNDARSPYEEARRTLESIGDSSFPADLAHWNVDLHSPRPLLELPAHEKAVAGVAFLAGGRRFVSGGEDGVVRVGDARTGATVSILRGAGAINQMSLRPDGQALACAAEGGVTIWDLATGKASLSLQGITAPALSVAFSPDGTMVLVGTTDARQNVYLFDARSGELLRRLAGHEKSDSPLAPQRVAVTAVAFTTDGKHAVTGGGSPVRPPRRPEEAFGPDRTIEAGPSDTTVRLWDLSTGTQEAIAGLRNQPGLCAVTCVVPRRGGTSAIACSSVGVFQYDFSTRQSQKVADVPFGTWVQSAALSPDESVVALAASDGSVMLCRPPDGKARPDARGSSDGPLSVLSAHRGMVTSVAFSTDGRSLLTAGVDGSVKRWPVAEAVELDRSPEVCHFIRREAGVPPARIESFATISPDERLALSGGTAGVVLWDVASGRELARVAAFVSMGRSAAFAPGGRTVVLIGADGRVEEWDLGLTRKLRDVSVDPVGRRPHSLSIAFDPDGRQLLAYGGAPGEVQLYSWPGAAPAGASAPARTINFPFANRIYRAVVTPDGSRLIAVAGREGGGVCDMSTGTISRLDVSSVYAMSVCPDGRRLACAGPFVQVVDLAGVGRGEGVGERAGVGRGQGAEDAAKVTLRSDFFPHRSLALTRDGRYLASLGDRPQSMWVWDIGRLSGGEARAMELVDGGDLMDLAFFGDGQRLLAAQMSSFGTVNLFDFGRPGEYRRFGPLLHEACRRLDDHAGDGEALATFGRWYAFRGRWAEAADLLEDARRNGATVPPLEMARCEWNGGRLDKAAAEFAAALAATTDDAEASYLKLCLRPLIAGDAVSRQDSAGAQ